VVENGVTVGFQVRVRSHYYKGVWLSQLRPGAMKVDDAEYAKDDIVWEIGGVDYTPAQMEKIGNVNWDLGTCAVLKVKKPGGLAQGYHDVEVTFGYSASYMPPFLDDPEKGVRFRSAPVAHTHTRRMLIV
jgi:hypothetical protein